MKKYLFLLLLPILSFISCSDDEGYFNPILASINDTQWGVTENINELYFQKIESGDGYGCYIAFKAGEFTIKYSSEDVQLFSINGTYEYDPPLLIMTFNDNKEVQYKIIQNKMELISPNTSLGNHENISFPNTFYRYVK